MKRTVEISQKAAHLSVRHKQLVLKHEGELLGQVPCSEVGVVVVSHPQATYTHQALTNLANEDAVVILCGNDHQPLAMLLPLSSHTQVVWRLNDQVAASQPLKKRLWKQLIVAKLRAQACALSPSQPAHKKLLALSRQVRSGDTTNVEAQGAKVYWANWLNADDSEALDSEPFRRDPKSSGVNGFLNYGYAILRAAISRSLVGAGLHPSLGLKHSNRGNMFCLSDDLIEPFRPLVDIRVREMYRQGYEMLNQDAKSELLRILLDNMTAGGLSCTVTSAISTLVSSLVSCFEGNSKTLAIPSLPPADC
ncbi:type II CRISPR-associated endonuclease Cas1 [Aeoliella mucimassa]|uniref:CRISPR-associated endonuclease Cas1 n=1 Tax=Aeoliella mucimassa TaxID=2527972 RepID=A0A518APT8_9BACT|nr:type II CRISPR-associated endonuclease Cas1 [Aeoliella mucimassa]QDU56743.1 CRISPR-associated endonuclease Cas1 [Aeoliella mucimassa]